MIRALIPAALLLMAAPGLAETPAPYGPQDPSPPGHNTGTSPATAQDLGRAEKEPAYAIDPARAKRERIARSATRWEYAYLALSAIDAAQTCDALGRGVAFEGNPLIGKNPACGKVIAIKAVGGALHYLLFRHLRNRDPRAARLMAQISTTAQGAVVGLNLRYTFRGR